MKQTIEYITLDEISGDQRFNLNSAFGFNALSNSVASIGNIYPLLAWKHQNSIILVDGFKRLEIAKNSNRAELPFILLPPNIGLEEIVNIRYHTIKQEDIELNAHQKISIYTILKEAEISDQKLHDWQIKLNLMNPEKYIKILGWPNIARDYIYNYNVSVKQLLPLFGQSNDVIAEIFSLATSLSIRILELCSIVETVSEIALNEKVTIISIFNRKQINTLLENKDLNRNQKILKLKKILYDWRYPTITKYQNQLEVQLKELTLNAQTSIQYDKFFETAGINLSAKLRNVEDLDNLIYLITNTKNMKTLKTILNIL